MEHTVQKLEWYLESLSKESLKTICRNYEIKGYSSKNKEALIALIQDEYFADDTLLNKLLKCLTSDYKLVFFELANGESNVTTFNRDIPDTLFLFYPESDEHLVIPKDVKAHFKNYIERHEEMIEEMKRIEFYHSALNLYGFVSLKQLSKLGVKYEQFQMSELEVADDITKLLPEYADLIIDNSVKHKDLTGINIDLKKLTHNHRYYEPATKEAFFKYNDPYYVEPSSAIDSLKKFLTSAVTEQYKGTYTAELIVNTIIFGLRANNTPNYIIQHIEHIEKNGFLEIQDHSILRKLIEAALMDSRLWSLNGNKKEVKRVRKVVQLKQKKKKRKKKK
ncbi:hypothetical protein [Macrococcus armenti]|uniref:hypothetical protein n=1 Tax=Macrococcus armenti TaxID=2875764 RepID=UPI001CC9C694|nr:hypothetical protein [Macrococcus armenti]UBH15223.1 hypothetical protein LAU44_10935 [Macrococcus armenti]UBH17582.1 hypothetical protein LAU39_10975 [Macrococcus armenti]UBH19848.1 hypothetical protein LAU40_10970 [Macrococcus armenti]